MSSEVDVHYLRTRDEPESSTHWSRILHSDLFNAETCDGTPDPREITRGDLPPTSYDLQRAARAHRAFALRKTIVALIHAAGAIVRRESARYRQRRQANATYHALRRLDDRTLRDLGFDRSELTSVAAEFWGQAESTRVRALTHATQSFAHSSVRRPEVL